MNQYFNVVPNDILKLALNDYNSRLVYETTSMNKATPGHSLELFTPIIEKLLNQKIKYKSGNFYKHKSSYLPHTDYRIDQNNTLNVVIPLWYVGELASLIVFDQCWYKNSVTWCLNGPLIEFKVNTGVPGNPYEYEDVLLKTNKPIDEEFYKKYLSHYSKECYWGLSGKAFPFEPGSIIIFDNRHIHCTSKFKGEKLGISLRYSI
jgi:hypothetical protein